MTNRRDSYIMAGIAVVMTAGIYFLLFAPQQRRLAELRESIRTLDEQLVLRDAEVAELSVIQADLKRANGLLNDYQTRIPDSADLGDVVEHVSAIANRLGLENQNIEPLAMQQRGPLTAVPIRISFDGDFSAAFNFLRDVERMPRVARVTELLVGFGRSDENPPRGGPANQLRTEMTMEVFYETSLAGPTT